MSAAPTRIVSLDQYRGYTVAGMLLVNFIGGYSAVIALAPPLKHYNTHCSYADTIMPQFLFAVGFAFRLTFLRRRETHGAATAWWQAIKRSLGLILLAAVIYHLDGGAKTWEELTKLGWHGFFSKAFERNLFQTLTHIGVTALWVLPVIGAGPWLRVGWMLLSVLIHVTASHPDLYPQTWGKFLIPWLGWEKSYYDWVMGRPGIDGGPLGFLTWTVPLLVGSLVYDAMPRGEGRAPLGKFLFWSAVLMLAGYGLSCLSTVDPTPAVQYRHQFSEKGPRWDAVVRVPPEAAVQTSSFHFVEQPFARPTGVVNVWTISQRSGSVSYLVFSTGFALAVYVLFILACDLGYRALGHAALALLVLGAAGGLAYMLLTVDPAGYYTILWLGTLGYVLGRLNLFRTFGTNALAAYVLHDLVDNAVKPWVPNDSPWWFALTGFGIFFGISYLFTRYLEKNGIFLKL